MFIIGTCSSFIFTETTEIKKLNVPLIKTNNKLSKSCTSYVLYTYEIQYILLLITVFSRKGRGLIYFFLINTCRLENDF